MVFLATCHADRIDGQGLALKQCTHGGENECIQGHCTAGEAQRGGPHREDLRDVEACLLLLEVFDGHAGVHAPPYHGSVSQDHLLLQIVGLLRGISVEARPTNLASRLREARQGQSDLLSLQKAEETCGDHGVCDWAHTQFLLAYMWGPTLPG